MMRKLTLFIVTTLFMGVGMGLFISTPSASANTSPPASDCKENSFLGFPYWYKYLEREKVFDATSNVDVCSVKLNGIKDIWLIVAVAIELLLRVASLVAIGFIIYGGVSYIISQGSPDKTKSAQSTVINAVIGLAISIIAAAAVSFVAGRF